YYPIRARQNGRLRPRLPPCGEHLPREKFCDRCLHSEADVPRRLQRRGVAPALLCCKSNSKRVRRRRVSLRSHDKVPCAESDGRGLRPSRGRASACLAKSLRPFPSSSARGRCLRGGG